MHRFPDFARNASEAVLLPSRKDRTDSLDQVDARPRRQKSTVDPEEALHHDSAVFYFLRPVTQLAVSGVFSLGVARVLRSRSSGRVRVGAQVAFWCTVEAVRLWLFRRMQRLLRGSVLRAPAHRTGLATLSHTASDPQFRRRHSVSQRDNGDSTRSHIALCRHLKEALQRGHRFEAHLRCHIFRRGLKDDFHTWLWLFHGVISNGGSISIHEAAMEEMRSLAAACCGGKVVDRNAQPPTHAFWGLGGVDNALPRPLFVDVFFELTRSVLSVGLRAAGFTVRRAFVRVANAEVEFMVWMHPGPGRGGVPCVFLHGAGLGAVVYTKILAHVAKYRRVIAIEVPGMSFGQVSEAGPAAVLDGLPEVVKSTVGAKCAYDVVGHSAGGWFTNVLLRAVVRGTVHAPRRVVIWESPVVVPAFLSPYLVSTGDLRDSQPAPYTADRGLVAGWLNRASGFMIAALFGKEIWHLHCIQCGFVADELVILPETLQSLPNTEIMFIFNERDGFTNSAETFAYVKDMLVAPHVRAVLLPEGGHGTFMVFPSEWKASVSALDTFLQQGHAKG